MQDAYQIINSLIRTEKGTNMLADNKYLFWVEKNANKINIKKAVEHIYKVQVKTVNTIAMRGKQKRVRHQLGKTPDWKKAIVTLKAGQTLDVT